ncbi:MAG: hypothetical protein HY791_24820 [Deltaproteobacteria bacterium]|nr:hypothetical protein [Deltaproteobacteria bacterium]
MRSTAGGYFILAWAFSTIATGCGSSALQALEARLSTPERLAFEPAFVGRIHTASVALENRGSVPLVLKLSTDSPFRAALVDVTIAVHRTETVPVELHAAQEGPLRSELRITGDANASVVLTADVLPKPVCDDENPCTDDVLDPRAGCIFPTREGECDDSNACTSHERCVEGRCKGQTIECPSVFEPCSRSVCIPAEGCVVLREDAGCDDSNSCTEDRCVDGTQCEHAPAREGMGCGEGDCTPKSCEDGACRVAELSSGSTCAHDGWNEPAGVGQVYAVSDLWFDPTHELDIDGDCRTGLNCNDNVLAGLPGSASEALYTRLSNGELRTLVEVVGYDQSAPLDSSLTVKVYRAEDSDEPADPTNDFELLPGESTCCEFLAVHQLEANGEVRPTIQFPARAEAGIVESTSPIQARFRSPYDPPLAVEVELVRAQIRLRPDPTGVGASGVLAGALPIAAVTGAYEAWCDSTDQCDEWPARVLSEGWSWIQPDLDLDGDGLERIEYDFADGAWRCYDGPRSCESCAPGSMTTILPIRGRDSASCGQRPEMADAWSMTLGFHAVKASIVGERRNPF